MKQLFFPDTVDSLVREFTTMTDKLAVVAEREQGIAANKRIDVARLNEEIKTHDSEASRALKIVDRIKKLVE